MPWASTGGRGSEVSKCAELYHRELGLPLPAEVRRALSDSAPVADPELHANVATVRSYLDAGSASLSAGAVDRGLDQLRLAVVLAQRTADRHLVAESLVTLSGALIHQAGGRGAEVADFLHRALSAEAPDGVSRTAARPTASWATCPSSAECRTGRPAGWTGRCRRRRESRTSRPGSWRSRACWPRTPRITGMRVAAFAESRRLARRSGTAGSRRSARRCWGACICSAGTWSWRPPPWTGRWSSVAAEHWTAFEPFVAGVRGETYLAAGRLEEAAALIDRSWVMAELAGDHCYMALAAGAEARLFLAHGDLAAAEHWIDRGLEPKPWYLWYTARLLDTAAEVTIAAGSPRAAGFVDRLAALASRSGMREFVVRAQSHRAALGDEAAAQSVPWLAKEIDNPALTAFLAGRHVVAH